MIADAYVWASWSVLLLAAVLMSALYAGIEMGMYSLNKIRLDLDAERGRAAAVRVRGALDRPGNLLAVLLIGTNISHYLATFAVSAMFVAAGYRHRAEWYTLAVVTPVLFVFGESVPKTVFRRLAETLVYRLAWFLRWSSVLFNVCGIAPVVRGMCVLLMRLTGHGRKGGESRASAANILAEGRASGVLTQYQTTMAGRVMNIDEVRLADVMTPMERVVSVPADVGRDGLIERARGHDYSRLAALDADGRLVGFLDLYEALMNEDAPLADSIASPLGLPATLSVTEALYRMQQAHRVIAGVVDERGRTLGIVAVKDLMEEIVGELEDM